MMVTATTHPIRKGPMAAGTLAVIALSVHTASAIVLDANFDHGSLDVAHSTVSGSLVQLRGRDNSNPGNWKWIYFSAAEVAGLAPVFQIGDNFETGGSNLVGHAMVYSYDQQTWHFFQQNQRDAGSGTFSFWNDDPFLQPTVYVAYGLPYSLSRAVNQVQAIRAGPWVTPTPSADAALVLGQSPGGIDDLGRTIDPQDLFGYRIQDPVGVTDRIKVVLASGVHANETLGNFVLEGLTEYLVGNDFDASLLRKYADFYVYPMVNPDGRLAGYNRSTVANAMQDPNRFWIPSSYGGIPEVSTLGTAMIADTGGADYLIDFHSTVVGKDGHYGYVHPAMQSDPFWQAVLNLAPELQTHNAALIDDTLARFGRDYLNAGFSMTMEMQYLPNENIDRFLELGSTVGRAFAQTLVVSGDLDLDGALDVGDFQILMLYAESDLSGLSTLDAYFKGDLNRDGFNNIVDFGIFKDAVIAQFGADAFENMLLQVPEPRVSCAMTLAVLAWVLAGRRGTSWRILPSEDHHDSCTR